MSVVDIVVMGANGRMGSTLAGLAEADSELRLAGVVERPGHEDRLERWGCKVSTDLAKLLPELPGAVVVDFTAPRGFGGHGQGGEGNGNPLVIGTTGLTAEQSAVLEEAAKTLPVFWAPNMSVGVNVLLKVLPVLADLLGEDFDLEVSEIHHRMKKDAPSGTAINLARCLAGARGLGLRRGEALLPRGHHRCAAP